MKDGQAVETGTHKEVMALGGKSAELYLGILRGRFLVETIRISPLVKRRRNGMGMVRMHLVESWTVKMDLNIVIMHLGVRILRLRV
jgi:hypothetical protein